MDKYVVFGNPVKHSLSPRIHRLFAEQTRQELDYSACLVEDDFPQAVSSFAALGGKGANVTLPYKEQAFELADQLSTRAKGAGAVNTLIFKEGKIIGDNTDGAGLVADLIDQTGSLDGKRVLLLGAGGAARGVIIPLFDAGVTNIHIANRTVSKAKTLSDVFSGFGQVSASGYSDIPDSTYDVVINSTSSSIEGGVPPIEGQILKQAKLAYDMFYQKLPTSFMQFASKHNHEIVVSDGLGMLIGQAAESFYLWRGVRPNTANVIETLKSEMA